MDGTGRDLSQASALPSVELPHHMAHASVTSGDGAPLARRTASLEHQRATRARLQSLRLTGSLPVRHCRPGVATTQGRLPGPASLGIPPSARTPV
jgi:hypothetical protein